MTGCGSPDAEKSPGPKVLPSTGGTPRKPNAFAVSCGAVMFCAGNSPDSNTWFGFVAIISENAGKAAYVGVEIFRMRLAAFVISAVYGGIGGTILAVTTGLADPELAYWTHSGNLVFMAVLGGSGSFAGPAIGALMFVVLQDFVMSITQYWRFVMGSVLVLLVVFMPQGLSGAIELLANRRNGGR